MKEYENKSWNTDQRDAALEGASGNEGAKQKRPEQAMSLSMKEEDVTDHNKMPKDQYNRIRYAVRLQKKNRRRWNQSSFVRIIMCMCA